MTDDLRVSPKQELLNAMIGCRQDDFGKQRVFLTQCDRGDRTLNQCFFEAFESPDFLSNAGSRFGQPMRNEVFHQRCAILKHSVEGFP